MSAAWLEFRVLCAEVLLRWAARVAPIDHSDGRDIVVMVGSYVAHRLLIRARAEPTDTRGEG